MARHLSDGAAILDLGCGNGHMVDVFRRAGLRPVGIDVEVSSAREHATRSLACGSAESIPFRDGVFDAVFVDSVIQYADRDTVLRECVRVLRPRGLLVAVENLRGHPVARAARAWVRLRGRRPPAHMVPRDRLRRDETGIYLRHFRECESAVFNLTTLLLYVPVRVTLGMRPRRALNPIYALLHRIDRGLLKRFPALEHGSWHIVLCAKR
ncbi:MAG TPA: class I SAM-dependent methyltransferase [Thermoanaerobaculia bacterium]|nr:class I SAM-dependent methyltransferase [Thermoanaerobaculia bacterium]